MIKRLAMWSLALGLAFALAACGGGNEGSATPADTSEVPESSDTVDEAVVEEPVADEPVVNEGDGGDDGCENALTADEIDSIFGTTVEISGEGRYCNIQFPNGSISVFSVFTGSTADDAMDELLPKFLEDEFARADGIVLDDGRGYVLETKLLVRGDSGRAFVLGIPGDLEVDDVQAANLKLAELLLLR